MRRRIALLVLFLLLLFPGAASLVLALFAYQIGLDNDPGWGLSRYIMAILGVALIAAALALKFGKRAWVRISRSGGFQRLVNTAAGVARSHMVTVVRHALRSFTAFLNQIPLVRALAHSARFFAVLGFAIVLFAYFWYVTNGTLTTWTPYSSYFNRLGSAFSAGQLHLLEQPPEELLALDNPYNFYNRQEIKGYLWDAVLYQGKYYFYWGAVPGLLVWAVKWFAGPEVIVEDQHLILAFNAGLNLIIALLLVRLRKAFYPSVPAWTLLPLVLLAGLAVPVLWLISSPNVYEVAIAGGQFFLFLGLYAAVRYITREDGGPGWLLAAGFAWGAAVNCRYNLAVAVIFFSLLLVWRALRQKDSPAVVLARLAWLGVPLLLWVAAMGWYNFARFGSVLETGHRYQLTGAMLTEDYNTTFSLTYLLPNAYSYLARPLEWSSSGFPFIRASYVTDTTWPWWIRLPDHYQYWEQVSGVLTSIPALLAVLFPALGMTRAAWLWINERSEPKPIVPGERWMWILLAGGAVCLIAPLLMYTYSAMRYLADVVPLLVVLAAMGYWKIWMGLRGRSFWRGTLSLIFLVLTVVSIIMSLMANFTNGEKRFEANNPALYYQMERFFEMEPKLSGEKPE